MHAAPNRQQQTIKVTTASDMCVYLENNNSKMYEFTAVEKKNCPVHVKCWNGATSPSSYQLFFSLVVLFSAENVHIIFIFYI